MLAAASPLLMSCLDTGEEEDMVCLLLPDFSAAEVASVLSILYYGEIWAIQISHQEQRRHTAMFFLNSVLPGLVLFSSSVDSSILMSIRIFICIPVMRIRCLFDSGIRDEQSGSHHISESLETIF
jgi:hypothetical protein